MLGNAHNHYGSAVPLKIRILMNRRKQRPTGHIIGAQGHAFRDDDRRRGGARPTWLVTRVVPANRGVVRHP